MPFDRPRIGGMRERVNFQRPTESRDQYGQPVVEWADVLESVPAEVKTLRGRGERGTEGPDADMIEAQGKLLVRIRFSDAVKPTHRVVWRGRHLEIMAIDDMDGLRRFLSISCSEVQ